MKFRTVRARTCLLLAALGLAGGTVALTVGPASATVTCPVVDASTHAVSPVPYQGIDWSGCDLSGADLTSAVLSNANLAGANLSGASLDSADLDTADLTDANLANASLTGADLDWATLTGAGLTGANLHGAYLLWAFLTGAVVDQADLGGTTLTALTSGGLSGTPSALPSGFSVADGYLIGHDVIMNGVSLSGMDLAGINLSGGTLKNADLSGADLNGSNLSGTDLTGASLTDADLTGASLSGATLTGTTLSGATLDEVSSGNISGTPQSLPANWELLAPHGYLAGPEADLADANLSNGGTVNSDFAGANLQGADLIGAKFEKADFAGANLSQVAAADADIGGSDLTGANLTSADLSYVNVGSANLAGADFTSATLAGVSSGGVTGTPQSLPANWSLAYGYLIGPYAYLDGASLAHANLSGLDFDHAYLVDVDLSYANLTGATMTNMQIGGDTWLDTICPDGTNSNQYTDGCFSDLDTTPPRSSPVVTSGTPGAGGWYTSPVTVDWQWSDDGTLVTADCPLSSTTGTQQGGAISLTANCTDLAGNKATAYYPVKVDLSPPAVSVSGVSAGHTYVYGQVPVAGCHTSDGVSGVAHPASVTVTSTGSTGVGSFTATCAGAADMAGNDQAAPVSVSYTVVYGFGGFTSPVPGSTLSKSARTIIARFRLTNASGAPITSTRASALAAAGDVEVTLSGPGISATTTRCTWNAAAGLFRCSIKIPAAAKTGSSSYSITALEKVSTRFKDAPAVQHAVNPARIHFR